MQEFVDLINSYVWSPVLVYLLLAAGLFFSVLTRFVQVRLFKEMINLLFSSKESDRGISSFQALSVSLSGRVGTGNIAGVAAAIGFGGPGAVFWMWVVAFLGAATAYVESALGQIYKEEDEGQFRGATRKKTRVSSAAARRITSKRPWARNGTRGYSLSRPSLP
jgi:AGCS family alanine or glycine:cation symporter